MAGLFGSATAPSTTAGAPAAFLWGDGGQQLTPAQVAAQQQMAYGLMAQQRAPQNVGEGLDAVGKALLAKSFLGRANEAQASGRKQADADMATLMTDPKKAMNFIANDQFASEGQKAVANALLQQQMMLTNPDMIANRAKLASETTKNNAEAGMFANGGAAVGAPVQLSDGSWGVQTQYAGVRPTAPPGQASPQGTATPASGPGASPIPDPAAAAPASSPATPSAPSSAAASSSPPARIMTPAELEQRKTIATGLGTDLLKSRDDAKAANDLQQYVQEGRALISQPSITGAGAEYKSAAVKWAASLGINVPQDAVNNSDAFKAVMGQAVGQIIKQFGSGTGLSDADRQYAQNIAGGNIELNKAAILRILDIAEANAQSRIDQYGQQVKAYQTGDMSQMLALPTPTATLPGPPPDATAPPVIAVNPQTGQRLQLLNGQWAPVQ